MRTTVEAVVVGCTHGELDVVYTAIRELERRTGRACELVLLTGDVQTCRDMADLQSLAAPEQHRKMGDFSRYFSGEKTIPIPTVMIGGNHEAALHLGELPLGGFVAPNLFYMGHAGVVSVGGVRIGGVSGIHGDREREQGHWERPPFQGGAMRSMYHTRAIDVGLLCEAGPMDVMLSHDWPLCASLANNCDQNALLRRKPFFRAEAESGTLGNPVLTPLAAQAHTFWFSSHLHVRHAAVLSGGARFLALDKPLPGRSFLQWVSLPSPSRPANKPVTLARDERWLQVLRARLPLVGWWAHRCVPLAALPPFSSAFSAAPLSEEALLLHAAQWGTSQTAVFLTALFGPDGPALWGASAPRPSVEPLSKKAKPPDPNALDIDIDDDDDSDDQEEGQ